MYVGKLIPVPLFLVEVSDNITTKLMVLTFVGFWSILKDIRQYLIPALQMLLMALLEGASSLISQGFVRHWSHNFACSHGRGGGPHSGLCWADGFETKQKRSEREDQLEDPGRAMCHVSCFCFVNILIFETFRKFFSFMDHSKVTINLLNGHRSGKRIPPESSRSYPSTLHASRNIWIIWAMRCYTSRQGAMPSGAGRVQARSPGIHVICSYSDTIIYRRIRTMLTAYMYMILGDWLAKLYHEDDE